MSLGDILKAERARTGIGLGELTVLSPQNDPYSLGTRADHHQKARWFQDEMEHVGRFRTASTYHNRGIYYAIVSVGDARLPDGETLYK